jgi:predicted RNA methylase
VTEELGQLRKDDVIPKRFRALLKKSVSSLSETWTKCNEYVLGIRTEPESAVACEPNSAQKWGGTEASRNARYSDNFPYGTIGYLNVKKVFRLVKPGPQDTFCDIGCGMGRILCVAARKPLRKCIGVELLGPLCEIARRNAASLRGKKAPVQIVCGDATTTDLSEGTIYFMFNPFGPDTLRDTLENIRDSLSQKPRAIKIAYYNAQFAGVLEALGWLVKVREYETFGGHRVTFWENLHS